MNYQREIQIKRISLVCNSCRAKKVKCDKIKPSCSRCLKHGTQCSYTPYRNKQKSATVESLQMEVEKLKEQLSICSSSSTSSFETPFAESSVQWCDLAVPLCINGNWKCNYPPFSDLGLFARDRRLRDSIPELFHNDETKKKNELQATNINESLYKVLSSVEDLMKMKSLFLKTIWPHYPFIDVETLNYAFDQVKQNDTFIFPSTSAALNLVIIISSLTKTSQADFQDLLQMVHILEISSSPSEHNLAILLYLKLSATLSALSLTIRDNLSDIILSMALELGIFCDAANFKNRSLRANLWFGTVILLDSHYVDSLYIKDCAYYDTTPLSIRYQIKTKFITMSRQISNSVSFSELEYSLNTLESYYETEVKSQCEEGIAYHCQISLLSLKLNASMLMMLLEEGDFSLQDARVCNLLVDFERLSSALIVYFSRDEVEIVILNNDTVAAIKILSSFALSIALRISSDDHQRVSVLSKLQRGIREIFKSVQRCQADFGWLNIVLKWLSPDCCGGSSSWDRDCESLIFNDFGGQKPNDNAIGDLLFLTEDESSPSLCVSGNFKQQASSDFQEHLNFVDKCHNVSLALCDIQDVEFDICQFFK
ncbi:LAFE_0D00452g1_1 [Lachancea fermentati]|uniref:LAFE_0D00452g1_1 n=1 Tax=Lachancea fermentati TaxID=4955 RepID=A0A1G4MB05_LACFM|nr:LAFE_0D00452g1_1 [Lachancea fermentati]